MPFSHFRINTHGLSFETEKKEGTVIQGNRIVELGYVLDWATNLQFSHSKICTMGIIKVKEEIRKSNGLTSVIVFDCSACNKIYTFCTENPKRDKSVINIGAVWGTLASGSTYGHMTEFLSCMDIPRMPKAMFYSIESDLGKVYIIHYINSLLFYISNNSSHGKYLF